jgi:hypothetical protein
MKWIDERISFIFPRSDLAPTDDLPQRASQSTNNNDESKLGERRGSVSTATAATSSTAASVTPTPIQVQPAIAASTVTSSSRNSNRLQRLIPTSAFLLLLTYVLIMILIASFVQSILFIKPMTTLQWLLIVAIILLLFMVMISDQYNGSIRPSWLRWCHYWLATGAVYVFIAPLLSILLYVVLIILMVVEALTRSAGVLVVIGITLRMILPSYIWTQINDVFWSMWQTAALLALSLAVLNFFRLSSRTDTTNPSSPSPPQPSL